MPKRKRRSKSKSGYFGVSKNRDGKGFSAAICISRKKISLGSYDSAKQAAKAYDKEAIRLRRSFSKLNYPKKAPVGYTPMQQPLLSTNTIGYRGVTKNRKKFMACRYIDGKKIYLGYHDTAKKAAVAYDRAVLKANKSTTLLNFPDMVHNLDVEPKRKKYKCSPSGYKGVYSTKNGKFQVKISIGNGKVKSVGTFNTAIKAAVAYDRAVLKANKSTTLLNFPDMVHNLDVEPKRKNKRSSTGYRGIQKTSSGRFQATIGINSKKISLGTFDTAIQAALAYDQAAIKAGKKKSILNFPDGLPIKEKEKESAKDGGYLVDGFIIQSYL